MFPDPFQIPRMLFSVQLNSISVSDVIDSLIAVYRSTGFDIFQLLSNHFCIMHLLH